MAAVVAPVCVQDTEFSLERIPAFRLEIAHHFAEVVGVHGKAMALAEVGKLAFRHTGEAGEILERLHIRLLVLFQHRKILAAAFHGVYVVMRYPVEFALRDVVVEYQ